MGQAGFQTVHQQRNLAARPLPTPAVSSRPAFPGVTGSAGVDGSVSLLSLPFLHCEEGQEGGHPPTESAEQVLSRSGQGSSPAGDSVCVWCRLVTREPHVTLLDTHSLRSILGLLHA